MGCGCGSKKTFSVTQKAYTIFDVIKDEILQKAKKVTKTQQLDRLSICNSCDYLFRLTKQCKKCGCFVKAKTLYAESFCPAGNWVAIQSNLDKVE